MVKKNEHYTVYIEGMTHEGQGVGKIDGFTVFVDGAIEGETVETKIIKIAKNYCAGRLIKIITPSEHRARPFCPVYGRCGGCSLQHASYESQLDFKTRLVKETIRRIGHIEDVVVHDTLGMDNPLKYRNKAQYPVAPGRDSPLIGFYARRSHDVVETPVCAIQDEASDKVKALVRDFIIDNGISVYDETTGEGIVRHVMTRVGFATGEVMVVVVINAKSLPNRKDLVGRLTRAIKDIRSIVLNINTQNTNVILGDKFITIYGNDYITDYIGKFKFEISPASFFQVNPVQTEVLYRKAVEYAGLTGSETVFDLYCGIGTISVFLSEKAGAVYGVESVREAVADARKNAKINGIENVEFICGEVEKVMPSICSRGVKADVVVLDPPRKGCDAHLLEMLAHMRPNRIVYVSCNPSTLARDLNYLDARGYKAVEVQPVDMFPYTSHTESVARIERVKG